MFDTIAYAASGSPAGGPAGRASDINPLINFAPFILIFGIFYFLLIRPQQKRQQELVKMTEGLKKGDRVVTAGGVIGTVTSVQSDYVVIKVEDNDQTKMEILKSAITGMRK